MMDLLKPQFKKIKNCSTCSLYKDEVVKTLPLFASEKISKVNFLKVYLHR